MNDTNSKSIHQPHSSNQPSFNQTNANALELELEGAKSLADNNSASHTTTTNMWLDLCANLLKRRAALIHELTENETMLALLKELYPNYEDLRQQITSTQFTELSALAPAPALAPATTFPTITKPNSSPLAVSYGSHDFQSDLRGDNPTAPRRLIFRAIETDKWHTSGEPISLGSQLLELTYDFDWKHSSCDECHAAFDPTQPVLKIWTVPNGSGNGSSRGSSGGGGLVTRNGIRITSSSSNPGGRPNQGHAHTSNTNAVRFVCWIHSIIPLEWRVL